MSGFRLTNTGPGYIVREEDTPGWYLNERKQGDGFMDNTCCHTKKLRGEEEKRNLMNRLKRIEGQVRGLQNMLEQDAYCPDILIQVSAVTQALNSFNKELLAEHIRSCVVEDIRADRPETVDELVETLKKVMR